MIERRLPSVAIGALLAVETALRLALFILRSSSLVVIVVFALLALFGRLPALEGALIVLATGSVYLALRTDLWSHVLFEPLGMWRCAWLAMRLAYEPWGEAHAAGALAYAGRAALRGRGHDREVASRYLRAALARAPRLDGGSAVAGAISALVEERPERARQLFEATLELDGKAVPRPAQALAREWLSLDACERGDWMAAERWSGEGARTRATRLVHAIARRMAGANEGTLWLWWLLAPRRRATRHVVRWALEQQVVDRDDDPPVPPRFEGGAESALRLYLAGVCGGMPSPPLVAEAVRAAEALDADRTFRDRARSRARALGVEVHGDVAVQSVRAEVIADLVMLARSAGMSVGELHGQGALAEAVARQLRDELMAEVERSFDALGERIAGHRRLPPVDELVDWYARVEVYRRVVAQGGTSVRQLLWPIVHKHGCDYGCWLHEHRRHRVAGNAVFRFLLAEARALDDVSAVELQESNVRVGW